MPEISSRSCLMYHSYFQFCWLMYHITKLPVRKSHTKCCFFSVISFYFLTYLLNNFSTRDINSFTSSYIYSFMTILDCSIIPLRKACFILINQFAHLTDKYITAQYTYLWSFIHALKVNKIAENTPPLSIFGPCMMYQSVAWKNWCIGLHVWKDKLGSTNFLYITGKIKKKVLEKTVTNIVTLQYFVFK